ncbi:hypothetical protein VM98_35220, partial [Streptomyces rubellomurinus subsp. indigoferus]
LTLGEGVVAAAASVTELPALTGSQVTGVGLHGVAPAASSTAAAAPGDVPGSTTPGSGTRVPADGGGTLQPPQPPGTLPAMTASPGAPLPGSLTATAGSLPATVFAAYRQAEASLAQRSP